MISPAEFIPIAEETGLIKEIGQWVLDTACREAATWPAHIRIAVNVSPVQFKSQTLALNIATALANSSLRYLHRFAFDKIKIDRSYVKEVTEGTGSISIIRAVVGIAAERNIVTTAEGVETRLQLDTVRALGCTQMQGYLFSAARPPREIRSMLGLGEAAAFGVA